MSMMKKEVAIIGAGAAGLAAMRSLFQFEDKVSMTAFEISSGVGGLWVNRDPHRRNSMYDNYRANVPKELMAYAGFPFPESDAQESSFVHNSAVLEYLNSFADHYSLRQYIKFRHRVIEVDPYMTDEGVKTWNVTVQNEDTGAMSTYRYDAVIVCNGNENCPYIPDIEGHKTYKGEIMHSTYHQDPKLYTGKTVVVLGALLSGADIAMDIHNTAKHVYLSHNARLTTKLPDNIEQTDGIDKIRGDDIILKDGSVIQADMVILATGYRYDFSFLSDRCRPEIKDGHIKSLYRMMISINHPSLYFIGLNKLVTPFHNFGIQSELAAAFISEKIPPVPKAEMEEEYRSLYKRLVTDHNDIPKHFHHIPVYQHEYNRQLGEQSGTAQPVPGFSEKFAYHYFDIWAKSLPHFKEGRYRIVDDDNFEILYIHPDCKAEVQEVNDTLKNTK